MRKKRYDLVYLQIIRFFFEVGSDLCPANKISHCPLDLHLAVSHI